MHVKTNTPNYIRDTSTGALINTDNAGHAKVIHQINELKKINYLENRLNSMETDITDIKMLLQNILSKVS